MNNPQVAVVARPPGREHIPIYPTGFIAVRIVQLVVAVLVMALAAYGLYYLAFDGNSLIMAVAIMTLITSIYHLVAHYNAPAAYNYWAILGLDVFFVVMWLCAFALLAARVAPGFAYTSSYSSYSYSSLSDSVLVFYATQATAASLGGVEFILYITSLIIHSIRLHRHRAAGLHCMPGTPPGPRPRGGGTIPPGGIVPVPVVYTDKNVAVAGSTQLPMYQQYPPAAPVPGQQQIPAVYQQPQPGQQMYPPPQGAYPAPQGGYFVPVPMPMPMPEHQIPGQQQQVPGQQGVFYAPASVPQQQPSPAPIVPQPTGGSHATSTAQGQNQQVQVPGQ